MAHKMSAAAKDQSGESESNGHPHGVYKPAINPEGEKGIIYAKPTKGGRSYGTKVKEENCLGKRGSGAVAGKYDISDEAEMGPVKNRTSQKAGRREGEIWNPMRLQMRPIENRK